MGAQTMGSQGGGTRKPKSESLATQGSLYSLTLEEVENHLGDLGKPLSSMNLDELLKSVWTAETNNADEHRQGSVALCRDLTKKTVDEVWRDIQQQQGQKKKNKSDEEIKLDQEREATLGEMTLEDFLVKAGVVAESPPQGNKIDASVLPQHNINVLQQYQVSSMHQPQQQQTLPVLDAAAAVAAAYPETQMTISSSPLMGMLSDTQTPGRKRVAPGDVVEKTVERRQKRMIKNRESAARSRARRQAYTHELENKVSRLEEENERLKKQKEVEKVVPCEPPPEPKYQLRRINSSPF